jgi:hypothetical protein
MVIQMAKNFLTVLGNPKILYCHNSPQQVTILSHINPVHIVMYSSLIIHF